MPSARLLRNSAAGWRPLASTGRACLQVGLDPLQRHLAHRHQSVLAALAGHPQHALAQVQPGQRQLDQFGHPQAGGIHQLEHRAVAQAQRAADIRRVEQRLDLALGQRLGQAARRLRPLDQQGGIVETAAARAPGIRSNGETTTAAAPASAPPPARRRGRPTGPRGARCAASRPRPASQRASAFQVAPIGLQRAVGQAVLGPDPFEEGGDAAPIGFGDTGGVFRFHARHAGHAARATQASR